MFWRENISQIFLKLFIAVVSCYRSLRLCFVSSNTLLLISQLNFALTPILNIV